MSQDANPPSSLDEATDVETTSEPIVQPAAAPTDAPVEAKTEETQAPVKPVVEEVKLVAQNVFITMSPLSDSTEKDKGKPFLVLPSNFPEKVVEKLSNMPNVSIADTEKTSEWLNIMNAGFEDGILAEGKRGMTTLEDPGANFQQKINTSIGDLFGRTPTFPANSNETLQGEKALLRFMQYKGLGTIFKFPLYHTGIWVTLKAPSDGRLLELHRQMVSDRLGVGRNTHGLSFANTAAYHNESLFEIAIEHIYQLSLSGDKPLREVISVHDIPTLIWGLACTIWNTGYLYRRSCTHAPEECNYVADGKIDLAKLSYVNTNALTEWQVKHMTNHQQNSMKWEDVERYQKESLKSQKLEIKLDEGKPDESTMILRIPSAGEYFNMARRWLGEIVRAVELAIGSDASVTEKQSEITNSCKSTMMRQYGHWIESIHFGGSQIVDRDTIELVLDRLSADDDCREEFSVKVRKYIDDSTLSLFGIPTYTCPNCHRDQLIEGTKEGAAAILPIDFAATFFILLVQKLQQITLR